MHDQRSRLAEGHRSTARQDRITRQAVLIEVLDLHPAQVTVSELVRQMTSSPDSFGERDRIERAVFALAGAGLLHKHDFLNRPDALVAPTLAALEAHDLLGDDEETD